MNKSGLEHQSIEITESKWKRGRENRITEKVRKNINRAKWKHGIRKDKK